jgi:hypothetical protein
MSSATLSEFKNAAKVSRQLEANPASRLKSCPGQALGIKSEYRLTLNSYLGLRACSDDEETTAALRACLVFESIYILVYKYQYLDTVFRYLLGK